MALDVDRQEGSQKYNSYGREQRTEKRNADEDKNAQMKFHSSIRKSLFAKFLL